MSKRESICEHCEVIFTYKNDRMGKFCSQKCHYGSKRESANCSQCRKEFKRRKKDPRKTCSTRCFMISRGIKSKDPIVKETCEALKKEEVGQMNVDESVLDKIRRAVLDFFTAKS